MRGKCAFVRRFWWGIGLGWVGGDQVLCVTGALGGVCVSEVGCAGVWFVGGFIGVMKGSRCIVRWGCWGVVLVAVLFALAGMSGKRSCCGVGVGIGGVVVVDVGGLVWWWLGRDCGG